MSITGYKYFFFLIFLSEKDHKNSEGEVYKSSLGEGENKNIDMKTFLNTNMMLQWYVLFKKNKFCDFLSLTFWKNLFIVKINLLSKKLF